MKVKSCFHFSRRSRRFAAACLQVFLAGAVLLWPQNVAAQQPALPKLTLGQVEQLVSHGVPDSTLSIQIHRRGLAFTPTPAIVESLRVKGAGPLTLAEIDVLIPNGARPLTAKIPMLSASGPAAGQTQLTLQVARSVIPAILTNIYRSLDQGDPQAARQYLSGDVLNDVHRLDAICMPYSYRAHYVSSVIERPGPVFEARVRTLFKPFEVRAQVFSFIPSMGSFMVTQVERDPMSAEIESARETVRQFIFAVRAGRWDVAARYASPGLPLDQMKSAQWTEYFSKISRADVSSDDTRTKGGLLLLVRMEVRGDTSYLPDFLVDPETGLIVRAFFRSPENIYSQLPDPAGFTDPETEANSLKRFGLTTNVDLPSPVHGGSAGLGFSERDGTLGGVYRVGGDISAPVPTFSPEAVFSDEARREKYQGDCVVGLVVDAQGNPQNVHIVRGLGKGLDEKAIEAVKRYRFTPAMRNGITPVPVYVNIEVQFRLY